MVRTKETSLVIHGAVTLEERGFGEDLMEDVYFLDLIFFRELAFHVAIEHLIEGFVEGFVTDDDG